MRRVVSITGLPFSGVNTISTFLQRNYKYKHASYNTMVDSIYNDLLTVLKFSYPQRTIAKTDVELKNGFMIERSLGVPADISVHYVARWIKLVEQNELPLYVKLEISNDLSLFSQLWRGMYVKESLAEFPADDFVVSHASTLPEYNIVKTNSVNIWIECDDFRRFQFAFAKGVPYDTSIYTKKVERQYSKLKKHADFIIYNNDSKHSMYASINQLFKEIGITK